MVHIMNKFRWIALYISSIILLLFPFRIFLSIWSAPIETGLGWIWIVAFSSGVFIGIKKNYPTNKLWTIWLILAFIKISLILIPYQNGVFARFKTSGLVYWGTNTQIPTTIEKSSPPRYIDGEGWQLHRDTYIPPFFINDHRRFNYYPNEKLKRDNLPFQIELKTKIIIPSNIDAIIAPYGGNLKVGKNIKSNKVGLPVRIEIKSPAILEVDYSTTASTSFRNYHWINFEKKGKIKNIPQWCLWSVESLPTTEFSAKIIFLSGYLWNIGLFIFLLSLWKKPLSELNSELFSFGLSKWALPILLFLSIIIPIEKDEWFYIRIIISLLLIFFLSIIIFRSHSYRKNKLLEFISILSPKTIGWIWVCFVIVIWTIMGTRFFDSRFPRGFAILPGGMDTLFHYTYAREILNGDWFHKLDAPFTRQPFIRYLLLIPLYIMGEGPAYGFDVHWTIFALIGSIIWSYLSSISLVRAWIYLSIWYIAFLFNDNKVLVPTLFPEIWGTFFLVAAFRFIVDLKEKGKNKNIAILLSGIFLSLSIWTRNNLLLILPFWLLIIILQMTNQENFKNGLKYGIFFVGVVLTFIGIITVRNKILAPEAPLSILMTPEWEATAFFQGFQLKEITKEDVEKSPYLRKLRFPMARFIEGVHRHPFLFIRYQIDRILILIGLPAFSEENLIKNYPRFNLWHLFLWGLIIWRIILFGRKRAYGYSVMLCWGVIFSQILILFCTGYIPSGYRLLIPVYPFLLLLALHPSEVQS